MSIIARTTRTANKQNDSAVNPTDRPNAFGAIIPGNQAQNT